MEERGGEHIDPLGYLRAPMPQNLSAEQTPDLTIAGDTDAQALRARVMGV